MKIDMNKSIDLWEVLVELIKNKRTYYYWEISKELGGYPPIALGAILSPIQEYCKENKLPRFTSIVINSETGMPWWWYDWDYKTLAEDQNNAFNYPWEDYTNDFILYINKGN